MTSKRDAEPQIIQRAVYQCEIRSMARLARKKGVDLPYGPSDPQPVSSGTSRFKRDDMLQMKYFIALDEKKRDEIPLWLFMNKDEPAYQVRYQILTSIRC